MKPKREPGEGTRDSVGDRRGHLEVLLELAGVDGVVLVASMMSVIEVQKVLAMTACGTWKGPYFTIANGY